VKKIVVLVALVVAALIVLPFVDKPSKKGFKVAILTPTTHPSLEEIERGFKEELGEKYHFTTYNAQGSQLLMRSEVREMERKGYDLILTIATQPSIMAYEMFQQAGNTTPMVCAAVDAPEDLGLVNVTGVNDSPDFGLELDLITEIMPDLKEVLLVYNRSSPHLDADRKQVQKILHEKGIFLRTAEVFQVNELQAKVASQLKTADLVMVLKDNVVVSGLDVVVKLCRQRGIPLLSSDLDSFDRGATYSFGVFEVDIGREAARKARLILEEKREIAEIPFTILSDYKFKSHRQVALKSRPNLEVLSSSCLSIRNLKSIAPEGKGVSFGISTREHVPCKSF